MCAMHRSMGRLKMCVCACRTTGESFAVGIGSTVKVTLTCGAVPGGEARTLVELMGGCLITCPPGTPASQPGTHLPSRATSLAGGGVPSAGLVLEAGS